MSEINKYRIEKGGEDFTIDYNLCSIATIRSTELAQSFTINRPDGRSFETLYTDNNINYFYKATSSMESYGSYKVIVPSFFNIDSSIFLDSMIKYIGIGKRGIIWTVMFGG